MNFIKNLFHKITRKANETAVSITEKTIAPTTAVMANNRGDGYVSDGLRILISVVIGALLLAGLYALFNSTIMPTVTSKVQALFNYSGT